MNLNSFQIIQEDNSGSSASVHVLLPVDCLFNRFCINMCILLSARFLFVSYGIMIKSNSNVKY